MSGLAGEEEITSGTQIAPSKEQKTWTNKWVDSLMKTHKGEKSIGELGRDRGREKTRTEERKREYPSKTRG